MKKIVFVLFLLLMGSPVMADFADGEAAFSAKRYSEAMQIFRSLADAGDVRAQYYVAYMYLNGYGVTKNTSFGLQYLQKSLDQDYHLAQALMGFLYEQGEVVPQDYRKAVELYQKAAEQENTSAMLNLAVAYYQGNGVPRNLARATELLEKIPIDVQPAAGRYLGDIYLAQDIGKANDAIRAYSAAAKAGDLAAYVALAQVYFNGTGVSTDADKGLKYYQYAASQGYAPAQYALGLMYANGKGVSSNLGLAHAWLSWAASQNYEPAVMALAQLKTEMTLSDLDQARREFINIQNNVLGEISSPITEDLKTEQKAKEESAQTKTTTTRRRRRRR